MSYNNTNTYERRDNIPLTDEANVQKINVNKFMNNLLKNFLKTKPKLSICFIDSPKKQTETIALKDIKKDVQFISISRDFIKSDGNHYKGYFNNFIDSVKDQNKYFDLLFLDVNEGLTKVSNTIQKMFDSQMLKTDSIVIITIVARGIRRNKNEKHISCPEYANNKLIDLFNENGFIGQEIEVPDCLVVESTKTKKNDLPINCSFNGGLRGGKGAGPTYSFFYKLE